MKKGSDGYYRHTWTYEGKRYSVRASTERDLWKKVSEKERALETGQIVTNANTRAEQWMYDYLETYKKNAIGPKMYHEYTAYVKNYIAPAIGSMRMKDIRPIDLQRILNQCAGRSLSHASKLRNVLRMAFNQARKNHIILTDPAADLELPHVSSGTHRAITEYEREHILQLCETHRASLWVLAMLYCGLRPGETMTLKWDDVDFEKQILYVRSAAEGKTGAEKTTKTRAGVRKLPIPSVLCERLNAAYAVTQAMSNPTEQQMFVFTQPTTGRRHTHTSMRQMWESFRHALDIHMGAQTHRGAIDPDTSKVAPDLVPYCLRHTYGTDLQTAGVPINVAKDLMGHSDISLTSRIYTHFSDEAFDSAAALVENYSRERGNKILTIPHNEKEAGAV